MQHQMLITVDDSIYQPLMERVGQDKVSEVFAMLIKPYLLLTEKNVVAQVENEPSSKSLFGKKRANIKILGDIIEPTTQDSDWKVYQW